MAGHVYDRWTRPSGQVDRRGRPIPERTDRWGNGKRWRVTYYDAGQRRAKSFDTRDAAEQHLATVQVQQREGSWVRPNAITVTEYGTAWVAAQLHHRPASAEQLEIRWRLHIEPAFRGMAVADVQRRHVQATVAAWAAPTADRKGLAPSTIRVAYSYLAAIFRAAVDDRLIRDTPCRRISLPVVERARVVPLTVEQVRVIIEQADPRYRAMVVLAATSGLRSGELRGLTVDRLEWLDSPSPVVPRLRVVVDRQLATTAPSWGPPKTSRSDRTVLVDAETARAVLEHLTRCPPDSTGLVFRGREGRAVARGTAQHVWHQATVGMTLRPRSGWHDLRHFHASLLIAAGLSVTAVADRLGHEDASETLRTYAHLWPTDEARSVDAVHAALWGS